MTGLTALWLPILVSAVIIFVASSIIHMLLPWHKSDYAIMPNEAQVGDALRPFAIPPGDYLMPRPKKREDLKSPEFAARVKQGPNLVVTILPNEPWSMGRNLGLWFVYCLVVSIFAAVVVTIALPGGYEHRTVFHLACLTAFIGYSLALWQMTIWFRRSWSVTIKATVDGLIYAVLTAATFVWLWPR
jgi:hypothetical protein